MLTFKEQLDGKSGFEQFLIIFSIESIVIELIKHLYDIPALKSFKRMSEALSAKGQLRTWDLQKVIDLLETKINNAVSQCWSITNSHYLPRREYAPCHICGKLKSFNDDHISTHLGFQDGSKEGPRSEYLSKTSCLHCIAYDEGVGSRNVLFSLASNNRTENIVLIQPLE